MKKINLLFLFLLITTFSYSEIKISVFENMKFQQINPRSTGRNILGRGTLEIQADPEDFGKIVELVFTKKSLLTNGKNPIQVENISIEEKFERFEIKSKVTHVNFYGVINKKKLTRKKLDPEIIAGDYVGGLPIRVSIYEPEKVQVSK